MVIRRSRLHRRSLSVVDPRRRVVSVNRENKAFEIHLGCARRSTPFLIVAESTRCNLPNPRLIALLWILALVALIVLSVKDVGERWGSRIAFVAFALVLCYWSALGLLTRKPSRVRSETAARLASTNGEVVARLAAMPRLANPFRWDCVFETDRAMYRFDVSIMGDNSNRPPCALRQTRGELKQTLDTIAQQKSVRVFPALRGFQSRSSKIPVARLKPSFN